MDERRLNISASEATADSVVVSFTLGYSFHFISFILGRRRFDGCDAPHVCRHSFLRGEGQRAGRLCPSGCSESGSESGTHAPCVCVCVCSYEHTRHFFPVTGGGWNIIFSHERGFEPVMGIGCSKSGFDFHLHIE